MLEIYKLKEKEEKDLREYEFRENCLINDILDTVITYCNTGIQYREKWEFVFDNNKCIGFWRNGNGNDSYYKGDFYDGGFIFTMTLNPCYPVLVKLFVTL